MRKCRLEDSNVKRWHNSKSRLIKIKIQKRPEERKLKGKERNVTDLLRKRKRESSRKNCAKSRKNSTDGKH